MGWKSRLSLLAAAALLLVLGTAPRSAFSPGSVPASAIGGGTANCVPYFDISGTLVCTSSPTYTPSTGLSVPDAGDGTRGLTILVNTTVCPEPVADAVNICGVGTAGSEIPQIRFHGDTAKQLALTTDNVGGTSFTDSAFDVHNLSDPTKKIVFNASGLDTGKTVTLIGVGASSSSITLPSLSGVVSVLATGFAAEGAVRQLGNDQHIFSDYGALIGTDDGFYIGSAGDLTKRFGWLLSGMTAGKTLTLAGVGTVDSTVTVTSVTSSLIGSTNATHHGITTWGDGDDATADTGDMVCAATPGAGACVDVKLTNGTDSDCTTAQSAVFYALCK